MAKLFPEACPGVDKRMRTQPVPHGGDPAGQQRKIGLVIAGLPGTIVDGVVLDIDHGRQMPGADAQRGDEVFHQSNLDRGIPADA